MGGNRHWVTWDQPRLSSGPEVQGAALSACINCLHALACAGTCQCGGPNTQPLVPHILFLEMSTYTQTLKSSTGLELKRAGEVAEADEADNPNGGVPNVPAHAAHYGVCYTAS